MADHVEPSEPAQDAQRAEAPPAPGRKVELVRFQARVPSLRRAQPRDIAQLLANMTTAALERQRMTARGEMAEDGGIWPVGWPAVVQWTGSAQAGFVLVLSPRPPPSSSGTSTGEAAPPSVDAQGEALGVAKTATPAPEAP